MLQCAKSCAHLSTSPLITTMFHQAIMLPQTHTFLVPFIVNLYSRFYMLTTAFAMNTCKMYFLTLYLVYISLWMLQFCSLEQSVLRNWRCILLLVVFASLHDGFFTIFHDKTVYFVWNSLWNSVYITTAGSLLLVFMRLQFHEMFLRDGVECSWMNHSYAIQGFLACPLHHVMKWYHSFKKRKNSGLVI